MSEESPDKKRKISNTELDTVKNYMIVELSYDNTFCLPYKDGVALLACLENAEKVKINGYGDRTITFDSTTMSHNTTIISQQKYREAKMKLLLGVDND